MAQAHISKAFPRGDAHLGVDQVHIRDLYGDGVLHLDPRVHLNKDVLARSLARSVDKELDGASIAVANGARKSDGIFQ